MEISRDITVLVEWFILALVSLGAAAALGGGLFSWLAAMLRVRDSSLALLGRLIGLVALLWMLGPSANAVVQRHLITWWQAELAAPAQSPSKPGNGP